jgi:FkbM family methyltransferase
VRQAAVGARSGRAAFCVVDDASWSRLACYGTHVRTRSLAWVDVEAVDELIRAGELPVPDVVKIDVDGCGYACENLDGADAVERAGRTST